MSVHIMVDLETMGRAAGCAILTVGAVAFDPLGEGSLDKFDQNIALQSCLDAGLTINHDTLLWWMAQSEEARSALISEPRPLAKVIYEFDEWFTKTGAKRVWSHGAAFDLPILKAAHQAVALEVPWKYSDERDTRTLYDLAGITPSREKGVLHKAIDDAMAQVEAVQQSYRKLGIQVY